MTSIALARETRGTKRHCQHDECGLPFYDLKRDVIVCPYCSSAYTVPVEPPPGYVSDRGRRFNRYPLRIAEVAAPLPTEEAIAEPLAADAGEDEAILDADLDESEEDALSAEVEPSDSEKPD